MIHVVEAEISFKIPARPAQEERETRFWEKAATPLNFRAVSWGHDGVIPKGSQDSWSS